MFRDLPNVTWLVISKAKNGTRAALPLISSQVFFPLEEKQKHIINKLATLTRNGQNLLLGDKIKITHG